MSNDDPFAPDVKPAFLDPERAAKIPYQSGEAPVEVRFDHELACEHDPAVESTDLVEQHPGGKGPSPGYKERWRAIARYNALGWNNTQIGTKLNYSPTAVSLALKSEWVQAEVARYRSMLESDITHQVKEAAKDGATFIHETILNEKAKDRDRLDASKWAIEKTTGKAKQEIGVESNTLTSFMDLLRDMQRQGDTIDVTPSAPATAEAQDVRKVEGTVEVSAKWAGFLGDNL